MQPWQKVKSPGSFNQIPMNIFIVKDIKNYMSEKRTTNFCSLKKRTLQTLQTQKANTTNFVDSKSKHYKFLQSKKANITNFVDSKSKHYKLLQSRDYKLIQSISKLYSLLESMSDFCSLLVNFTDFCSLSAIFCSLSVSISLLRHTPSFLGQISHDMIIVADALNFQNMPKSCCLVLFSQRKMQNGQKKPGSEKNLLPHISITKALQDIIQTDSRSYSVEPPLSFFCHFWKWLM